jgi:invasion protein IalB
MIRIGTATFALAIALAANALAQTAPPKLAVPPPTPPAAPAPDRTTASFGDWVLRCDRRTDLTPPQRFCELGQTVQRQGDTGAQAQFALGRLVATDPMRFTLVLPINIGFQPAPKLVVEGPDALSLDLGWVRCLPSGCFANAAVSDDMLRKMRAQKGAGRLDYHDGATRDVVLPISFKGFSEAFDALTTESSKP